MISLVFTYKGLEEAIIEISQMQKKYWYFNLQSVMAEILAGKDRISVLTQRKGRSKVI